MTETSFYILLCLRTPNHGYGIVQKVRELTENEVVLGPGTMYGSLSKMEKDGLIEFVRDADHRLQRGRHRQLFLVQAGRLHLPAYRAGKDKLHPHLRHASEQCPQPPQRAERAGQAAAPSLRADRHHPHPG